MDHLVAEYEAVVRALRYLLNEGKVSEPIEVNNDNEQLWREMKGLNEVGRGSYTSRYEEARELTSRFPKIDYKLINGESNWEADCLAWKEYRRYLSARRSFI